MNGLTKRKLTSLKHPIAEWILTVCLLVAVTLLALCTFNIAPAKAQGTPCQWNYSMVNGQATATYCGNVTQQGQANTLPTMSALSALSSQQMQQAGAYNLTSYYPLGLSGGGLFQWQNTTTLTPDGGTVIAPANNPGSCSQGCMIRQLSPPNEISPEFFGARCRQIAADGTVDTSGMLAAVAAAHNNGYLSIKTKGVCALNSTIDLSNFSQTINIDLGGVIEGSTFPPIPSWTGATSFFTIGGSGGGQVSINLSIGYTTGLDADVIHITGPGSAGGSKFFVGYASQVNGVIYVYGNTSPVSVNQFAGNYWIGCVNPNINSCGNFGILLYPGAQPAESNIVSTNWISNFDYGGVIEGNGASFTSFLGAMESNGQWDSQICSTGTITGFALGDTVAQGVSRGIVLSPSYTYQNHFCIAVQETKNVSSSRSNFTVGQVLTD